jgi:hypothetical protein
MNTNKPLRSPDEAKRNPGLPPTRMLPRITLRFIRATLLSPEQIADLSKTFGLTLPKHGHEHK